MMFDNFLSKALFISLTIHTVLLCSVMLWRAPQVKHAAQIRNVAIDYKLRVKKTDPDLRERPIRPAQKLDLKNSSMGEDGVIPLKTVKENQAFARNFMMYERKPEQVRSILSTRRVAVVPIKSEKINSPAYAAYNEMVRSRIEEKVYANFTKMEPGSVYLTFIITADGTLKAFQTIVEKTHATQNLRNISTKSLQQAQFPPFFKGMTLPEYTFNIEIQYQVKD